MIKTLHLNPISVRTALLGGFALPFTGMAAGIDLGEGGVLETIEVYVEVLNLFVAVAILSVSFTGLRKVGGTIQGAWKTVVVTAFLFAVFEILGTLEAYDIFVYHGLREVLEFAVVGSLLLAVIKLRKLF